MGQKLLASYFRSIYSLFPVRFLLNNQKCLVQRFRCIVLVLNIFVRMKYLDIDVLYDGSTADEPHVGQEFCHGYLLQHFVKD